MRSTLLALTFALSLAWPTSALADAPELEIDYTAADPDAPAVTAADLLARERFWPYHAALSEAWTPPGEARAFGAGVRGVLVRVEVGGRARIDFGRDGVHEVPVAKTDLVAAANQVREGQRTKAAPNYVLAVANRLTDANGGRVGPAVAAEHAGFVSVFADPASEGFDAMVRALARLDGRKGVKTVIFPQGRHPGLDLAARLTSLGWKGYQMDDAYSPSYTEAQLEVAPPAVLLVTPDGRRLLESAWAPATVARLEQAIDAGLGAPAGGAAAAR